MTENQLNKLKGRLLNVQTQLAGAGVLLAKNDPLINSKVQDALKIVKDVYGMCDTIKPEEEQQAKAKAKKKYQQREESFSYLTPHVEIVHRKEAPTYNRLCRNYSEIRNRKNEVIERTCVVGMDMCYCSKKCAYATNNVCSTRDDGKIGGKWR